MILRIYRVGSSFLPVLCLTHEGRSPTNKVTLWGPAPACEPVSLGCPNKIYHSWGGFDNRNLFSLGSGGWKSLTRSQGLQFPVTTLVLADDCVLLWPFLCNIWGGERERAREHKQQEKQPPAEQGAPCGAPSTDPRILT